MLCLTLFCLVFMQSSCSNEVTKTTSRSPQIWTLVANNEIKQSKDSLPKSFLTYQLNENELRKQLKHDSLQPKVLVKLPLPDSTMAEFSIIEVQVMSPALAAKYPSFKTYEGIETTNRANRVRLDFNDKNFHAYFITNSGEYYIAPVDGDEKNLYMVFRKEDSPFPKLPFEQSK